MGKNRFLKNFVTILVNFWARLQKHKKIISKMKSRTSIWYGILIW